MKQATITINLYSFDELSETAKQYAINEHRDFLLSTMSKDDFISGDEEYDTPEKLQEQYDSEYEYYSNNDEPIIESIEINEYLFHKDGQLAHTVHYVAGYGDDNGKEFYIDKNKNKYELKEVEQ